MAERTATPSPAEKAAQRALESMFACIRERKSFRLEAGAGAGKTYSLVKALKFVIDEQAAALKRHNQRVACITYTNVASDQITSQIDRHPVVHSSTIHSFCWALISCFQPFLRDNPEQQSKLLLAQGFYFEGRFNYEGRLFLTAGFRQEINSEFQNKATHKLEVIYQFKESETKFRVSHATGFRVPSQTDDLFTPLINPSESRRDEISPGFTE